MIPVRCTLFVPALLALGLGSARADPERKPRALFALIVGVNRSVDADQEVLRYADDDAARYLELFRSLGARATILTRIDANTQRLHPQAAAEALQPEGAAFVRASEALALDVKTATNRGLTTAFYFVYAGHGRVRDNEGYLALEDQRLREADIRGMVERIGAHESHLIVDACHSEFLAHGRGYGGVRRPAPGFVDMADLARRQSVGLFLATSATGESHEWEGFQAGVFSHEVRSGLYGAADVGGDGIVSYRELAAFVARANSAVVNERYRPRVVVRPPQMTEALVDLRPGLGRQIRLDGSEQSAHHVLEDENGIRVLDFHNSPRQKLALVRPASKGQLFLRRTSDNSEFVLPSAPDVVTIGELLATRAQESARGAAHKAFSSLFKLPFGQALVDQLSLADYDIKRDAGETPSPRTSLGLRRVLAWTAVAATVTGAAAGTALLLSARQIRNNVSPTALPGDVEDANSRIGTRNHAATACFVASGVAAAGALWLLWLDRESPRVGPQVSADVRGLLWTGRF